MNRLKSSLKLYGRHRTLVNCYGISVSQMTMVMFFLLKPPPFPFFIHDLQTRFLTMCNMMGATSEAGNAYPSRTLSSPQVFVGVRFVQSSFLCRVLLIIVCLFVLYLLAIVLSLLGFLASDYPCCYLQTSNLNIGP